MATMQDVARRANVSLSTVSNALNNTRPVAAATRARIERAIDELGYRRNVLARGLASRNSRIVALLFPAMENRLAGTALTFVTSAADEARAHGYHLVLWPLADDADAIQELVDQGLVEGVVVMEVGLRDPRVDVLAGSGLPFTMIGRTEHPGELDYADIDFDATLDTAVGHLRSLGHSRIALINGPESSVELAYGPVVRIEQAYRRAMSDHRLDGVVVHSERTVPAGRIAAGQVVVAAPDTTAIIVNNEHAAAGVVTGLTDAGRSVPADVSVISLLSSPEMAAMCSPRLTTLDSPGDALGRAGVRALVARIEKKAPTSQVLLPCTLHAGDSVALARGAGVTDGDTAR
ncbi:LacI family DNA-binding transcriptional regulator [Phytoactinopolyspora halotolerans]|uniref:LacI family transcriptional regulator n=1 Tax=Phytoactinopolyspora halotolerans TaxID=1981512 RepID=A0A6L9SA46_9ACTN|nr:LacI family DNA-binding transcriptional regulator [Phytoactinopolyspora halotolerans]NEE01432.1 LacI family transcriptional regulator [Phytoactinopolyspora halotolerans]